MERKLEKQYCLRVIKKFYKFLRKEKIYDAFVHNFERYKGTPFSINTLRNLKYYDLSNIIDESFQWSLTPQGHAFWSKKNYQWYDEAKKIYNKLTEEA